MTLALRYLILVGGGILMLTPFFWLVSSSFKTPQNIYIFPPQWIPNPIYWRNYVEVFDVIPVMRFVWNTVYITVFASVGVILSSAMAAYGFARLRFKGRDLLFSFLLSTVMLPYVVTMIPVFIMFSRLGWVDSFKPLIVPHWFGGPITIFLLRQFFRTIPLELEAAARIDGASRPRIFLQVILPLARPALVVVSILALVFNWNGFLEPLIYLRKRELYTLALAVNSLKEFESGLDWTHYMMVVATIMVVPVLILYFLAQRAFIEGIVLTGLKG